MPFLFQYLIKFSLSVAVLYIFYFIVLRPLTFYQWNRFYLLCYSLLSFIIPFINITDWLTAKHINDSHLINSIPAVDKLTSHSFNIQPAAKNILHNVLTWNFGVMFFLTGALIMLVRIVYQYLSLRAMKRKAVFLKTGDFEFYDVNGPISPFSFANSIFVNSRLHTEEEFHRILEHEFVHVKQKHTIDIVAAELVCILNWFNPFAWLIRKAIRQNLEFIADKNVLEGGIDPRQYQYLLLKVMGLSQYSIANNFSFSSLKKRIVMMNKMKTAKVHLVKFLFILPLLSIMLLAFRDKIDFQKDGLMLTYAGIVINAANNSPLHNIVIKELNTNLEIRTDEKGYFKLRVPVKNDSTNLKINFLKDGDVKKEVTINWVQFAPRGSESFIGLVSMDNGRLLSSNCENCFVHQDQAIDKNGIFIKDLSYETVAKRLTQYLKAREEIKTISGDNKPIVRVDKGIYVMSGNILGKTVSGAGVFSSMVFRNNKETPAIYLNGMLSTISKVNTAVERVEVKQIDHLSKEAAFKKYGKLTDVIDIVTYSGIGSDTIPLAPVPPVPPVKAKIQAPTVTPVPLVPVAPVPSVALLALPPIAPAPKVKPVKVTVARLTYSPDEIIDKKSAIVNITPVSPVAAIDTNSARRLNRVRNIYNGEDPLYIIDGKQQQPGDFEKLDPHSISSIDVLKNASASALYGDKAKFGVVIIHTKEKSLSDDSVSITASKIYIDKINDIKSLITVNGKEISKEQLAAIDPGSIQSISVLKNNSATDLYGEKGKDGVIVITLKK